MARRARAGVPHHAVVENTLNNVEFRRASAKGLATTHQGIYQVHRPTNMEGYVGQCMYFEGTMNLSKELASLGFGQVYRYGQHLLLSANHFGCPVFLTLHCGYAEDGHVRFNREKGPVFRKGILENSLNYSPLQPSLFDSRRQQKVRVFRKLNLGIVHSVSPKRLYAWLFVGTKWLNDTVLECPLIAMICKLHFEESSVPDIARVNDDSDYGVDFGEKAVGTQIGPAHQKG